MTSKTPGIKPAPIPWIDPSSRRKNHHSHGKERRHRKKNVEERKDTSKKEKEKNSGRHDRHKSRERAEEPLNVSAQTTVIPDFLL